jgi:hypothetical protein
VTEVVTLLAVAVVVGAVLSVFWHGAGTEIAIEQVDEKLLAKSEQGANGSMLLALLAGAVVLALIYLV